MNTTLLRKLISFGLVGTIGFAVDAGLLTLLSAKLGLNVYLARLCSFTVAVFVTWIFNRKWVFRVEGPPATSRASQYISYLSVQTLGALINLGVFSLIIFYISSVKPYPIIPLAIGSIVAMFFNFLGAQIFVFKGIKKVEVR